jgi:hypothetical protein
MNSTVQCFVIFLQGEIVEISAEGFKSKMIVERKDSKPPAFCFFEYIYFARMDSIFEGEESKILKSNVKTARSFQCYNVIRLVCRVQVRFITRLHLQLICFGCGAM